MKIILASASPRRAELLKNAGVEFEVIPSDEEEAADANLSPAEYTVALAREKAQNVARKKSGVILGADTVVEIDGEILGKPKSPEDATATLMKLSGRTHRVYTSFCVIYGTFHEKSLTRTCVTEVEFNALPSETVAAYVASGKPLDKAGSYGIQDGYGLVKSIKGSLGNVIGLPVEEVKEALEEIENEQTQNCR